ncbi:uncharacterized protein ACIQIH_000045 [Cyanocitta cristata]
MERSADFVWKCFERSVLIQITNKTQDVALNNPRTYFYSGHSTNPPSPMISPGVTEQSHFTNSGLRFWGCTGVLVYEADTFTLAILFCNPLMYSFFHMKLALEISLCKGHYENLKNDYTRMYSGQPLPTDDSSMFHQIKLSEYQEPVVVSAGNVRVTATMSNAAQSSKSLWRIKHFLFQMQ